MHVLHSICIAHICIAQILDAQGSSANHGSKHAYIIDVELICASCNDDTNKCLNGGICSSDGECKCENGATGDWCQIQPTYNGHCDIYYNKHEFNYDVETAVKVHVSVQTCIHAAKMNPVLLILAIVTVISKQSHIMSGSKVASWQMPALELQWL
jgi:hypothetical protein